MTESLAQRRERLGRQRREVRDVSGITSGYAMQVTTWPSPSEFASSHQAPFPRILIVATLAIALAFSALGFLAGRASSANVAENVGSAEGSGAPRVAVATETQSHAAAFAVGAGISEGSLVSTAHGEHLVLGESEADHFDPRLDSPPSDQPAPTTSRPAPIARSGRADIERVVRAAAEKYGVDPDLMLCVAHYESTFRPEVIDGRVRGDNGLAVGLMQFHEPAFTANAKRLYGYEVGDRRIDPAMSAEVAAWMFSIGQAGQWSTYARCGGSQNQHLDKP